MKVLLDENFPLGLVRVLELDGVQVEHIITLGWRGASDTRIRTRLSSPEVLFLTQDEDFLFGETQLRRVRVPMAKIPARRKSAAPRGRWSQQLRIPSLTPSQSPCFRTHLSMY